jgi:hypothetical protein
MVERELVLQQDLDDARAASSALASGTTQEFALDGWESGAICSVLDDLRALARQANATN